MTSSTLLAAEQAGSGLGTSTAALLALGSALVLALLHLAAPHIRSLPLIPERATASFAGGIAVSYVFLHLLPELAQGNRELREVLGDEGERSPLLGLGIFFVALVGFLLFYGLERLAETSRTSGSGTGSAGVFRVHLGSFAGYNAIIGYTLILDWRSSVAFSVLFTVAIGLHFVLIDRGLEEHYGDRFDQRWPRLVLAASLLVGWGVAALFAPTSSVVVSLLTAFLAGSILLNVFKEEIPSTRRSHFGWFVLGAASYALLLGLVTAASAQSQHGSSPAAAPVAAP